MGKCEADERRTEAQPNEEGVGSFSKNMCVGLERIEEEKAKEPEPNASYLPESEGHLDKCEGMAPSHSVA